MVNTRQNKVFAWFVSINPAHYSSLPAQRVSDIPRRLAQTANMAPIRRGAPRGPAEAGQAGVRSQGRVAGRNGRGAR